MRVALDAMGGDFAPRELVAGALAAVEDPAISVVLVGDETKVSAEIDARGPCPETISIVHASEVIGMAESPVEALKKRQDASILVALRLVAAGAADACVAAGSTGAAVAASLMSLKRLQGVRRPGIAVPLPANNQAGVCFLLDAGANPNCRPHHLLQYGVMGANYFREVVGVENPRVGLVSIGEEETKGTNLTKEAGALLRASPLNFVGNVEGAGLFGGACDVAVADGFVGNIVLKTAEGCAEMIFGKVAEIAKPATVTKLRAGLHYADYGGAPLLGVDGTVMICHGRSDGRAIANAIRASARAVDQHVNDNIVRGLTEEANA